MLGTVHGGKYRIERLLGKGGMGTVYAATHLGTSRPVALKVLALAALDDVRTLERFQQEARASGTIDSPHVVQVLDSGVDEKAGTPYLVMEYLAGEDLHELVTRAGALPTDLVLRIIAQACLGLQSAHEAGIVHRDIKSANLFLARRNDTIVTKLLDFGIAKVRKDPLAAGRGGHGLTTTGTMLGSPLYMSPEQARGSKALDGRADIWSLGVVMYEALTGATPFGHCESLGDLILAVCSDDILPIESKSPSVPPEVAAIVGRALTRDPSKRFQTPAELRGAIMKLLPDGNDLDATMLAPFGALPSSGKLPDLSPTRSPETIDTEAAPLPAPSSAPRVSAPPSSLAYGQTAHGQTVPLQSAPIASSKTPTEDPVTATTTSSRASRTVLALVALLGVIGYLGWRNVAADQATASRITPLPSVTTAPTASSAPPTTSTETTLLPLPSTIGSEPPHPSASVPPPVRPHPVMAPVRPATSHPHPTAKPANDCDPPYWIDATGKHFKEQCL